MRPYRQYQCKFNAYSVNYSHRIAVASCVSRAWLLNIWRPGPVSQIRLKHTSSRRGHSKPTSLFHLYDNLAFCTPTFDVSNRLGSRFEWKDPIHHRTDNPRFNKSGNLA